MFNWRFAHKVKIPCFSYTSAHTPPPLYNWGALVLRRPINAAGNQFRTRLRAAAMPELSRARAHCLVETPHSLGVNGARRKPLGDLKHHTHARFGQERRRRRRRRRRQIETKKSQLAQRARERGLESDSFYSHARYSPATHSSSYLLRLSLSLSVEGRFCPSPSRFFSYSCGSALLPPPHGAFEH